MSQLDPTGQHARWRGALLATQVRAAAKRIKGQNRLCSKHGIFRDDRGICWRCEADAQKRESIPALMARIDQRFMLA